MAHFSLLLSRGTRRTNKDYELQLASKDSINDRVKVMPPINNIILGYNDCVERELDTELFGNANSGWNQQVEAYIQTICVVFPCCIIQQKHLKQDHGYSTVTFASEYFRRNLLKRVEFEFVFSVGFN
ncbi:hypothetical protein BT96DRAFT_929843 [Gymnopus androsaceus JB14]|uniref:Uncharacterized protein n=1 Tax=Gymnopus androsaceus JB14 TaxID=1447944 RepID=A0A6A4GD11_9AGAR|nr:hypothetical protein BT96DRAFT_929843 [Gymnopus androsaceus JB14]